MKKINIYLFFSILTVLIISSGACYGGSVCGLVTDASTGYEIPNVLVSAENGSETITYYDGSYCLDFSTSSSIKTITFQKYEYGTRTIEIYVGPEDKFTINIKLTCDSPFNIKTNKLADAPIGLSYNERIEVECGIPGYIYFLINNSKLPPGLIIDDSTGNISGIPTEIGDYHFSVGVTDKADNNSNYFINESKNNASSNFSISVFNKPAMAPDELPGALLNKDYIFMLDVTFSGESYTITSINDNFEDNFSLSKQGMIKGKPVNLNPIHFTALLKDSNGRETQKDYTIQVYPEMKIETEEIISGIVNKAFNQCFEITGGCGKITWFVESGYKMLPPGLWLDPESGCLTGVPVNNYFNTIIIGARDSDGHLVYKDFKLQIANPLQVQNNDIPVGLISDSNEGYEVPIEVIGGIPPYKYLVDDILPDWLTFEPERGIFTIYENNSIEFNIYITISDSGNPSQSLFEKFRIKNQHELTILSPPIFKSVPVEKKISDISLKAAGGDSPMKWSVINKRIPDGLNLSENGVITGTPVESGSFYFTLQLEDRNGKNAYKNFIWHIYDPLEFNFVKIKDCIIDMDYHFSLSAKGGEGPYLMSLIAGELPQGLSYNPDTKIISGICKEDSNIPVVFQLSDNVNSIIKEKSFPIIVKHTKIVINPEKLPNGKIGQVYNESFNCTKGVPGYKWEIIDGFKPDGLNLIPYPETAILSGTPTKAGDYTFRLKITDSDTPANEIINTYTIKIFSKPEIVDTNLKFPVRGEFYSDSIDVINGEPPYSFQIINGNLPEGLQLFPTEGVISGFVSEDAVDSYFEVKVTDSCQFQSQIQEEISLPVVKARLKIINNSISDNPVNRYYSYDFTAAGGFKEYIWYIIADDFPEDININEKTGELYGTPSQSGKYSFSVLLHDSSDPTGSVIKSFILNIKPDRYNISGKIIGNNILDDNISIFLSLLDSEKYEIAKTVTDSNGEYTFSDIPNGSYSVKIIGNSCTFPYYSTDLTINSNDSFQNNFYLQSCDPQIDSENPSQPLNLTASISEMEWSNTMSITYTWAPSEDNISQEISYLYILNNNPDGELTNENFRATPYNYITITDINDGDDLYFHVCARDAAGNLSDTSTIGPFYIDTTKPENCRFYIKNLNSDNDVDLFLQASDSGAGISHVQISKDALNWSDPIDYTNTIDWEITAGQRTLYAKFTDKLGNSSIVRNDQARFIIVGGGENNEDNIYWDVTKKLTSEVYRDLIASGFDDDMIYYMINTDDIDIDHDGSKDNIVDDEFPESNDFVEIVSNKFVYELNPDTPLFIYLQGHATDNGQIALAGNNGDDYIDSKIIIEALNKLKDKVDCTVILIIESCYSGKFIEQLKEYDYPKLVILSSAGNVPYITDSSGYISFSRFLFFSLREGNALSKSFEYTKSELLSIGYPSPMIYVNNDGVYDSSSDDLLASNIYLNFPLLVWNRPTIGDIKTIINDEFSAKILVEIKSKPENIKEAFIQIVPSDTEFIEDKKIKTYNRHDLTYNEEINKYELDISNLDKSLVYDIILHTQNIYDEYSKPVTLKLSTKIIYGDVNKDIILDLNDIILTLQSASSIEDITVSCQADINDDNRIGIQEAIYIMKKLSR